MKIKRPSPSNQYIKQSNNLQDIAKNSNTVASVNNPIGLIQVSSFQDSLKYPSIEYPSKAEKISIERRLRKRTWESS